MLIDPRTTATKDKYKLLTNLVVPRPIAWVTSKSQAGIINLAPYSFFNAIGSNPPYIMLSIAEREPGVPKDTLQNILESKEFVVNFVSENLLAAMNLSAADFPPDISELEATGLSTEPSVRVQVPRIADSKASLECLLHSRQVLGSYSLVIGEVAMFHVKDEIIDAEKLHIHDYAPVGRLGSPSMYCRTTDCFDLPRVNYEQVKTQKLS